MEQDKKIEALKKQVDELQASVMQLNSSLMSISEVVKEYGDVIQRVLPYDQSSIVKKIQEMISVINELIARDKLYAMKFDNIPYELIDALNRNIYWVPKIMTVEETIDEIVNERKSICRFGDGEVGIIYNEQRWKFQHCDNNLAERLKMVMQSKEKNILIGINDFYGDLSHRSYEDRDGIRAYIADKNGGGEKAALRTAG